MIATIDDATIDEFLTHDLCTLIVASSTCNRCIAYIGDVQRLVERGALGETRVGVLMLDQPGVSRFMLENPELSGSQILPYTMLFRRGERIDGFSAQRWHHRVDHSRQPELVTIR
jgi:hypothetical protein